MSDDVLIRVENVSKKFAQRLRHAMWYGLCDLGREMVGLEPRSEQLRTNEFWALKDVSFELKRGECLGVIGPNGAGKSTLLKLLNGIIRPTQGRIRVRGRVGALIEVGAGFHPMLTGRENIYVNGAILGMSRGEIDRKFDAIVDFADIGDFLDTPVKFYSSGMYVRLGFAIAAHLEPDILLIDEVLAVGDMGFVIKCLNRVQKLVQSSAVILVAHRMQFVSRFCTRGMLLAQGRTVTDAEPPAAIDCYNGLFATEATVSGTNEARVVTTELTSNSPQCHGPVNIVAQGTAATFRCIIDLEPSVGEAYVRIEILDPINVQVVISYLGHRPNDAYRIVPGRTELRVPLGKLGLNQGRYCFLIAVVDAKTGSVLHRSDGHAPFRIQSSVLTWGIAVQHSPAEVVQLSRPGVVMGDDQCDQA